MVWKQKDKELSIEEAIIEATNEAGSLWFGCFPLIVGLQEEDQFITVSLVPEFSKKNWTIFFIDPTDYSGEAAIAFAKEWFKRFNAYKLDSLIVLTTPYSFSKVRSYVEILIEENQIKMPLVMDVKNEITQSFGVKKLPAMILLKEGEKQFEFLDEFRIANSELDIQNFLRNKDPGLPLLPAITTLPNTIRNTRRVGFGFSQKSPQEEILKLPEFVPLQYGSPQNSPVLMGNFQGLKGKKLEKDEIFISGTWIQDEEKISTADLHAYLAFSSRGTHFSIIAETQSKSTDLSKVEIEIDGKPPWEKIVSKNLISGDYGESFIRVKTHKHYHLLVDIPDGEHEIILRFPNANAAPISIYGIRMGSPLKID